MTSPPDKHALINIWSFPAGKRIGFKSIDSFSVNYDISWDSVPIYGRQDPIQSYKSTGQTVSFAVPFRPQGKGMTMAYMIKALNNLLRPTYDAGIINQAPLLKVEISDRANPFYGTSGFVFAPSSVSLDYGDRARLIQQSINVPGQTGLTDDVAIQPTRILISFSGPIINIETVYGSSSKSSPSPTDPSVTTSTPSPQADAATANIGDYLPSAATGDIPVGVRAPKKD